MFLRNLILFLIILCPFRMLGQEKFVPSGKLIEEAATLAGNNQVEEAIDKLLEVDRSDTAYAEALLKLAVYYDHLKEYDNALDACNKGLELGAELESEFYNEKGKIYIDTDEGEKGRETLREGLKKYPYSAVMYYNIAYSFFKEKRYDSCAVYLEKTLNNNIYFESGHYLMGCVALAQGHTTKGLMAWSFYLQVQPEGEGALQVLGLMNNVARNIAVFKEADLCKEFQDNKDFSYIDQLVKGQVALNRKYKSNVSVDLAAAKQMQLIIEQFRYKQDSKDPFMRIYGPLFNALNRNKLAEPYIYVMLTSMSNKKVNKWKNKNDDRVSALFDDERKAVKPVIATKELSLPNQEGTFNSWYSGKNTIYAFGNVKDDNFENKIGYWRYFHPTYSYLMSEGSYNDKHLREGEWTYYYTGKRIKEKSTFRNDTLNGVTQFFGENGNVLTQVPYVNGKAEGEVIFFYAGGSKKEVITYKADERDGAAKVYFCNGKLSDEYSYKAGKIHGPVKSFYISGAKKQEINFEEGKLEGDYVTYYENGQIASKGVYKAGESVGKWVFYYENGKVSSEGEYDETGAPKGEWKSYYDNGVVSEVKTYEEGEITGNINYYDEDGMLHYTLRMDKGNYTGYTYYDKQGKVLTTNDNKKGNLSISGYDPKGIKTFEGQYVSGKEDGEWKYFHSNGKIRLTRTYKNGILNGPSKEFTEAGQLTKECYYEDNNLEGYFVEYFANGQKKNEGYLRGGLEQGPWISWYPNGKVEKENYYMDGVLEGYYTDYTTTGQKASETKYSNGLKYILAGFDTSGNELYRHDLSKGSGMWTSKYSSGKPRFEAAVSCHELNGTSKWYHANGNISTEQKWENDLREGSFKTFHENGKVYIEGSYKRSEPEGTWKWYYDNGQLQTEGRYVKGEKDSLWIFYFDNGKKDTELSFKEGNREGAARYYNRLGELILEKHYENDDLVSYSYSGADGNTVTPIKVDKQQDQVKAYFPNGKMSMTVEFRDGSYHGKEQAWYSNGQLFFENNYEQGYQTGSSVVFYSNGNKQTEASYFFGQLDGVVKHYREDGTLEKTETYVCGDKNGKTEYFDKDGNVTKTEYYWNDSLY